MTNVTVQEALKSALAAIDLYDYTMTVEESEKFAKAERLCKAALADIEKCEPVYLEDTQQQGWQICNKEFYDNTHEDNRWIVFTSPQPRDWVGLSNDDINKLKNLEGANRERTATEMAFAVQARLKQLNTKG